MARIFSTFLGVSVATLALGAVHLEVASGNNLDSFDARFNDGAALIRPGATPEVNRDDKTDRAATASAPQEALRTVSIKIDQLENTSVLIRVPANRAAGAQSAPAAPSVKSGTKPQQRRMVACEPVVSALTEVAKVLQPARCVT